MYHIYKNGYSTLPNLKKLQASEVFEKNKSDSDLIKKEKEEALKNQKYFFEHNNPQEFYEICEQFIIKNYPTKLNSSKYIDIVKETEEDFLIHRIDDDKDYLSSAHVCFASHWLPEEKIGTSFNEIHKPVPMNLKNSKKLVEAMIYGGMFERFVWSVIYEKRYNLHPRLSCKKFDKNNPQVHIKVERQVTVGFPEKNFCLFVLRQYLIDEKEIDKPSLINAIKNMTPEQKKYKSLEDCEDLIGYLSTTTIL
jgi:hypothetical protein